MCPMAVHITLPTTQRVIIISDLGMGKWKCQKFHQLAQGPYLLTDSQTLSTGICPPNSKCFQYAELYIFTCDVQHAAYAHIWGISKAGVLYKLEKYLEVGTLLKGFQLCILLCFLYLFHGYVCFHFD